MWLLAALACHSDPPATTTPTTPTVPTTGTIDPGFLQGQFCQVRSVFEVACTTGCHSDVVPSAGLDLLTDAHAATVLVPASAGGYLVVPGDPDASVLLQRMKDPTRPMPPQGLVDPLFALVVEGWIAAGAPDDCVPGAPPPTTTTPDTGIVTHHPPGWADPANHGPGTQLQTDGDCRSCHGDTLAGGLVTEVSCDGCHPAGWRTNCTFCHGGTANTTGAPPEDIDDNADPATISFPEHTEHVTRGIHPAYGCEQCHAVPDSVLTPGHLFDDVTAGYGELDYSAGLAPVSTYYQGTCDNVYCHGDGRGLGSATSGQPVGCGDCHAGPADEAEWGTLGGEHRKHLVNGVTCDECHQSVVDATGAIVGPDLHVQGVRDVVAPEAPYVGGTCTGTCHGENHTNEGW